MNGRRRLFVQAFSLTCLLGLLAGCTTIPQAQLDAYRMSFDQVRAQSENVLADYAAARLTKSNMTVRVPAGAATGLLDAQLNLKPYDAHNVGQGVESDVDVRLKAWAVLATYNDALAALASGKPGAAQAAANGLLDALKRFPLKEVAQVASSAAPFASAIGPILDIVEQEVQARQFRSAILKAAPLLDNLMSALFQDANLFYEYRKALLNFQFSFEGESLVVEDAMEFRDILNSRAWSNSADVAQLVKQVNDSRVLAVAAPAFPEIKQTGTGGGSGTEEQALQLLKDSANRLADHVRAARATAAQMQAYNDLMTNYARLLQAFGQAFRDLRDAAQNHRGNLPTVEQLETIVSSVRVAYSIYTQTK